MNQLYISLLDNGPILTPRPVPGPIRDIGPVGLGDVKL